MARKRKRPATLEALNQILAAEAALEKRPELPGVLGADGKRQHIRERIDASVKRAAKFGLGKLRRLA